MLPVAVPSISEAYDVPGGTGTRAYEARYEVLGDLWVEYVKTQCLTSGE